MRPLRPHWIEAPLDPDRLREIARRLDDPRFDFDLRLGAVERRDQVRRRLQPVRQVHEDQRVGARVHLDLPARREHRPREQRLKVLRLCVAQGEGPHAELTGERARFGELAALGFFLGEHGERSDADDRPLGDVSELVRAQDRLERLVPGDVTHEDVDRALHRRIEDDVEAAVLDERSQRRAQVRAVEVQRHRRADVAFLARLVERWWRRRSR
jgi:hypothetical protein